MQARRFIWFGMWMLVALLATAGCAKVEQPREPSATAGPVKVWPAPPEMARIAFVKSVTRPADVGVKASGLVRFGRWLTGSEKGNERLSKPFGVSLDENDNLCITDTGANVVCVYDRAGQKWYRWDRAGKVRFVSPVAAARKNGVLYVADSGLGALLGMDSKGELVFMRNDHLKRPCAVAIAGEQVFVADAERHCVVVFDLGGRYQRQFGRRGTGPGEFNFPTHLSATSKGFILVTDSMNTRVQVLDGQGTHQSTIGALGDSPGQFSRPKGAAADSAGNVYVVDAMFDNVQIFNPKGQLLLSFGEGGNSAGEFWLPNGIAVTRQNEIFVADSYNNRVQVFKYIGPT